MKKEWRRNALRQKWKMGIVESVHPWSRRKRILCHTEFSHGSQEMGVANYGELDCFIKPSSGDRVASVGRWEENEFSELLVSRTFSRQEVLWYGKMCIKPSKFVFRSQFTSWLCNFGWTPVYASVKWAYTVTVLSVTVNIRWSNTLVCLAYCLTYSRSSAHVSFFSSLGYANLWIL